MRRSAFWVALACCVAVVSCSSGSGDDAAAHRTWVEQQDNPPPEINPQLPGEGDDAPDPTAPPAIPEQPIPSTGPNAGKDPNVVADHLAQPSSIAMLPDGTALVGERTTGRILLVHPTRSPVKQVKKITGLDTRGDGGLLGLAVSPTYPEDGLLYAYVSTHTDNRVLRFTLDGQPSPILIGIPHSSIHNGGGLAFGPDHDLYVATGDTGRPALAGRRTSLAGKILRINVFGRPAAGNPRPHSAVYASGFANVQGMCWAGGKVMYATDTGGASEELNVVKAGRDYGPSHQPVLRWPRGRTGPAGCATIKFGLFLADLTSKQIAAIPLGPTLRPHGNATDLLKNRYGRLRAVVAAADGALWVSTSNRDGHGKPVADDDRILRIKPPSGSTTSPV